ncbi:MAG: type II toxin-antitoxin system RelE/ParE family toxin [Acidimicrobiales bacterium]
MEVELEAEVTSWYLALDHDNKDIVAAHVELLEEYGHLLRMPHSRPLGDGLFELRFDMSRQAWRITYWYRPDGVVVLLTVFRKQRNYERVEVRRALAALDRCRKLHQRE